LHDKARLLTDKGWLCSELSRSALQVGRNPYFTAYWFNLANPQHKKSPGDLKSPRLSYTP